MGGTEYIVWHCDEIKEGDEMDFCILHHQRPTAMVSEGFRTLTATAYSTYSCVCFQFDLLCNLSATETESRISMNTQNNMSTTFLCVNAVQLKVYVVYNYSF